MVKSILISVFFLLTLSSIIEARYPSKHRESDLFPRSIPENPKVIEPESSPKPEGIPEFTPVPKDLPRSFKSIEGNYGSRPEYGPREMETGSEDQMMMMGGDLGPCLSRRCNPFRRRKPSYRAYMNRMMDRRYGGPGFYDSKGYPKLPQYTEVIIIRKVPIMLSKLLVIAAAEAKKPEYPVKPEYPSKPDYPIQPPEPVYGANPGLKKPEPSLQKDQPSFEYKGRPKYDEKDAQFEQMMGFEKDIDGAELEGRSEKKLPEFEGRSMKTSDKKVEGESVKKDISEGDKEDKEESPKEYLEKPGSNELDGVEAEDAKKA